MKIWIVKGTTGEYSDAYEWLVCAYCSEEKAEERVAILNKLLMDNNIHMSSSGVNRPYPEDKIREAEHGDPNCMVDYTGTMYDCESCELQEEQ